LAVLWHLKRCSRQRYLLLLDRNRQGEQPEPSAYIQHVLAHIAEADTLEKLELLLPWNAELDQTAKKVAQID
jgi:hypothetical protein